MDYEYDVLRPSIEKDDSPTPQSSSTNTSTIGAENVQHQTPESGAEIPLPPSSPARSPRKTPRLQHHGSPPHYAMSSPARTSSSPSSPLNPERRSATPLLQNKKSTTSLRRGETPLRQLSASHNSYSLASSSPSSATMLPANGPAPPDAEKKPGPTAASIARDYLEKEMLHHALDNCDPTTVLFLHDSCYGHRYSRPRTSKSLLGTIVERPERIQASILGLSAAYVRMGGRHTGGLAPPHPDRAPPGANAVPFKIQKTSRSVSLNSVAATHVHGQKWMEELQIMCDSAEGKLALNGKELVRPIGYGKDENGNPLPKLHEGDLYLCSESRSALEGCLGGVCDAVDAVFRPGKTRRAFVCIRPPGHHCSSNYPSGFCWVNNVHVGITHAAISHGLTHAAIIDFDLHHGDGSQMIAWEHNRHALNLPKNTAMHKKTPIAYFSLHDINSYPCEMGDEEKVRNASVCIENAHGQSIWNVHLEPWKTHTDFWRLYESKYAVLIDKARSFLRHHTQKLSPSGVQAKAAIFLSAGFDASEWEDEGMQRHKVNVPTDFYARFTADVVRLAAEEGLGVDGRVISVLEGGYSDRALTSGVLSHVCGLAEEWDKAEKVEPTTADGLSAEMRTKLGLLKIQDPAVAHDGSPSPPRLPVDAEWWNATNLESLEALINPAASQAVTTKVKDKTGNYSSPTQASTAKMADHARVRRSLSAQLERMMEPEPVPPPPEVDWATAAYELSRLLIPADRQTLSCRYDELNAEATRVRRDRQSVMGLPTNGEQRMQLRDRKTKTPIDEATKPFDRRKTIAAVGDLPDPQLAEGPVDSSSAPRPRRRSSGTSSVLSGFQNMQISGPTSVASSVVSEKPKKPVVNKKPRVLAAAKVPKNPPVPRAASISTATTASRSASEGVPDPQPSAQAPSAVEEPDGLSSGIKKMTIKLKVPSPEENAMRERKAAEAQIKKPRPKKPALPKAPKGTSAVSKTASVSMHPLVEEDASSNGQGTIPTALPPVSMEDSPLLVTPALETVKPEPPNQVSAIVPAVSAQPTSSIDAAPSGGRDDSSHPAEESVATGADVTTAPGYGTAPETAQPSTPGSVKRTKADLPIFTSSSPIPFGRPVVHGLSDNLLPPAAANVLVQGPIPKSHPATLDPTTESGSEAPLRSMDGPQSICSHASETAGPSKPLEPSIWDVPETPQRPLV